MPTEFKLSVVAPDRTVVEEMVQSVVLPAVDGYLGVWANHEASIVALEPGILEYLDRGNQRHYVSINGGFSEIVENRVIVLADDAKRASEIDVAETEKHLEQARRALRGEDSSMGIDEATSVIRVASVRLKAARTK